MKHFLLAALAVIGFAAMPAPEAKAGIVIDLGGPVIVIGGGNRHGGHNRGGCYDGYNNNYNNSYDYGYNNNHGNGHNHKPHHHHNH